MHYSELERLSKTGNHDNGGASADSIGTTIVASALYYPPIVSKVVSVVTSYITGRVCDKYSCVLCD